MCTVVISVDPNADVPVLLAGVRDEFVDRPWRAPAEHWPAHPGVLGGLDEQADGTWLAVAPGHSVIAAVLNGRGRPAAPQRRRSRGELPLMAVAGENPHEAVDVGLDGNLGCFDPFHLLAADVHEARLWSWDGERLAQRPVGRGVHVITNEGMDAVAEQPRAAHFLPRFRAAARPEPIAERVPAQAWRQWLHLVDGDGIPHGDPRAIVVRRRLGERLWGSTSASLVALAPAAVRYDFSSRPGDPRAWRTVAARRAGAGPDSHSRVRASLVRDRTGDGNSDHSSASQRHGDQAR